MRRAISKKRPRPGPESRCACPARVTRPVRFASTADAGRSRAPRGLAQGRRKPYVRGRAHPPEPAGPRLCPAVGRQAHPTRPPRSDPGSSGTGVPSTQESRPLPSSVAPAAPNGSIHLETFASCGPVAMSPGSSLRLLAKRQNRTTRLLPNPDKSYAIARGVGVLACGRVPTIVRPTRRSPERRGGRVVEGARLESV